jgi:PTH1 family peptidyl-tRNA hydrolase
MLIVGLGNPGAQYLKTRHNAGFWFLDKLIQQFSASFSPEKKFKGEFYLNKKQDKSIALLKPMTFMNLSGESVRPCAQFYQIPSSEILVVHDELDLAAGDIRLKKGGGTGGHNGLKSIQQQLGTADFMRLRIGIGRPIHGEVTPFVLGAPMASELESINHAMTKALDLLPQLINGEWEKTVNTLHASTQSRS